MITRHALIALCLCLSACGTVEERQELSRRLIGIGAGVSMIEQRQPIQPNPAPLGQLVCTARPDGSQFCQAY